MDQVIIDRLALQIGRLTIRGEMQRRENEQLIEKVGELETENLEAEDARRAAVESAKAKGAGTKTKT